MTTLQVADKPGVWVRTSQGDVYVVVDGDPARPACVTVHGIPGSARDFRALGAEAGKRGCCFVRVDLPGFGRSPSGPRLLTTPAERAALLVELMRARGHGRFAVVGHSFGGTAALACAALFPQQVTALVLCNSAGVTRHRGLQVPHELTRQVKHLARVPVVGGQLLGRLKTTYERMGVRSEKELDETDVLAHTQIIGGIDFADLRSFAARVRCPSLVVSSADDRLIEPAVSFTLAAALSATTLTTHRHKSSGGHFQQKHDAPAIAGWLQQRLAQTL